MAMTAFGMATPATACSAHGKLTCKTVRHIPLFRSHPTPPIPHRCNALAAAYAAGSKDAGYLVRCVNVAEIDFPMPRSILFFFSIWLGDMSALLKGCQEQVARPGFAFERDPGMVG